MAAANVSPSCELALAFAANGWAVCPVNVRGVGHEDGQHRRTLYSNKSTRGPARATTDPDTVRRWWSGAYAGDGVAARPPLGITYAETDDRNGGADTAAALNIEPADGHARHGGRGWIFSTGQAGRGINKASAGAGFELFCESYRGVIVMPASMTPADVEHIVPAPAAIVDALAAAQKAKREHRAQRVSLDAIQPSHTMPAERARAYAEAVLINACADLRSAPKGGRHDAILTHGRMVGAVLHLGISKADALEAMTAAIAHYQHRNDDVQTLADALDFGARAPYTPKASDKATAAQFERATAAVCAAVASMPTAGTVEYAPGRTCRRHTMQRILAAIAEHMRTRGAFGVAIVAERDMMNAAAISEPRTVHKGIRAGLHMGFIRKVDRDSVACLAKFGDLDPRMQANAYTFNVPAMVAAGGACRNNTSNAEKGEGARVPASGQGHSRDARAHASGSAGGLSPHSSFSGVVLRLLNAGASAGEVATLRAVASGCTSAPAIVKASGLSRGTVYRNLARGVRAGVIICAAEGHYTIASDDALAQDVALRETARLDLRARISRTVFADRKQHEARVLAMRAGVTATDAPAFEGVTQTEREAAQVGTVTHTGQHARVTESQRVAGVALARRRRAVQGMNWQRMAATTRAGVASLTAIAARVFMALSSAEREPAVIEPRPVHRLSARLSSPHSAALWR